MAGYSQFMELSLFCERESAEVIVFLPTGKVSRHTEFCDLSDMHGELWCDLMDSGEDDVFGEVRMNGKTVLTMRKLGDHCS
jgi:hypothetical protein